MYPQVFDRPTPIQSVAKQHSDPESVPPEVDKKLYTLGNRLFLGYFLVTVVGGALRKWVFSEGIISNMILLALMVFPFLFLRIRQAGIQSPFKKYPVLVALLVVLLYHIINPYQKTFFHGMLGVLVYAPFWVGAFFILSNHHVFKLSKLKWLFIGIAIVEVMLCFAQYALPPGHFLNKYAVEREAGIAMVGDSVRVTGTFSFLSGLTAYTVFHVFLCWALLRWKFPPWVFFTFLLAGLILSFMSGSRSGTLIYLGLTAGILLQEFPPAKLVSFLFRYLLPAVIIFLVIIRLGSGPVFDSANRAIDNFVERTTKLQASGEQSRRLTFGLGRFNDLSNFPDPILGIGAGATYQGATILFGKSDAVIKFGYYESEFLQVFLEGGIVMLIIRITLIFTLLKRLGYHWLLKIFLFICMIYAMPIVYNVYNAAFLMMGIVLIDNTAFWKNRALNAKLN